VTRSWFARSGVDHHALNSFLVYLHPIFKTVLDIGNLLNGLFREKFLVPLLVHKTCSSSIRHLPYFTLLPPGRHLTAVARSADSPPIPADRTFLARGDHPVRASLRSNHRTQAVDGTSAGVHHHHRQLVHSSTACNCGITYSRRQTARHGSLK
jgi:hypothetical protein